MQKEIQKILRLTMVYLKHSIPHENLCRNFLIKTCLCIPTVHSCAFREFLNFNLFVMVFFFDFGRGPDDVTTRS